jgi:hypothetical protein
MDILEAILLKKVKFKILLPHSFTAKRGIVSRLCSKRGESSESHDSFRKNSSHYHSSSTGTRVPLNTRQETCLIEAMAHKFKVSGIDWLLISL